MTTSKKTWSDFEQISADPLTEAEKVYFREYTRRNIHDAILKKFIEVSSESGVTRTQIAQRLGINKSQVTRWLSSSHNWTVDSVSDLLLAMASRASFQTEDLGSVRPGNYAHPALLKSETETTKSHNDTKASGSSNRRHSVNITQNITQPVEEISSAA